MLLLPNFSIQEAGLPILPINRAAPYHLNSLLMFGKVLFYNYILFRIWNRIAISSVQLRLSGVTLGVPNLSESFFPNDIYQTGSFLAHLPPNFHKVPSGLTSGLSGLDRPVQPLPNRHSARPGIHMVSEALGLSVFDPSWLGLPA